MFQNHAAMFGHIEFFGPIAEHVVDEPRGQFQQELAAQRLQDPFDAHSVFDDAIQHQIPDFVVVMGLGEHALESVSERRAAFAPDASPNFQAQNGLLSPRSWWRSVRSLDRRGREACWKERVPGPGVVPYRPYSSREAELRKGSNQRVDDLL
jgi:hypothetical protein